MPTDLGGVDVHSGDDDGLLGGHDTDSDTGDTGDIGDIGSVSGIDTNLAEVESITTDVNAAWREQMEAFEALTAALRGAITYGQYLSVKKGELDYSDSFGLELTEEARIDAEIEAEIDAYEDEINNPALQEYTGPAVLDKKRTISIFGVEILSWTEDVHLNVAGAELGFAAEILADVMDVLHGVESYTTKIGSAIESGLSFVTAALTSAFTGASIAPAVINGIMFAFDVAYAKNLVSFETQRTVKALGTIASFGVNTITTMQNLMSLNSMSQYMTTEAKVLGYVTELVAYGVQVNSVLNAMQSYGLSAKDLTAGNIYGFDSSIQQRSKTYDTFEEVLDAFAEWNTGSTSATIGVINAESDPFEWKAGGVYYESQFAGNSLYVADEPRDSSTIAEDTLGLSYKSKHFILGEGALYQDLQQVDTRVDGENELSYTSGQIGQLNQLVSTYSGLIEDYNEMVNNYNSTVETYEPDGYSNIEVEDLTSRKDALDVLGTKITSAGEAITDLRTQFNI